MKKVLALLCAAVVLSSLSACTVLPKRPESGSSSVPLPISDSSETRDDSSSTSGSRSATSSEEPEPTGGVSIEEQVLVDQDDIVITAKSLKFGGYSGPAISILIENNSDVAVNVTTKNSSVNGIMINAHLYCDIEPGKKSNTEITLDDDELKFAGISTIKDIEMVLDVDTTDYDAIFESDIIAITTSADPDFVQEYSDEGEVLYEDGDLKLVMQGLDDSRENGYAFINVYMENLTDTNVEVHLRDVSVNGFMIDPIFYGQVAAGKRAFDRIAFDAEDLEENDIEAIEEIECSLSIGDADNWRNYLVDEEALTLTFE